MAQTELLPSDRSGLETNTEAPRPAAYQFLPSDRSGLETGESI